MPNQFEKSKTPTVESVTMSEITTVGEDISLPCTDPTLVVNEDSSSAQIKPLNWRKRPAEIQQKIKQVWENLKNENCEKKWLFHGASIDTYDLAGTNEHQLIKTIIKQNPERKDFYVLDIGAGKFGFSYRLSCSLKKDSEIPKDVNIHIIGITGEDESAGENNKVLKAGICTIYNLSSFPIEYLIDEFQTRNWDLDKKADVIVSHWALRHLVDPVGTFLQAYSLLRPVTGWMLMDGFYFFFNNIHSYAEGNEYMCWLLQQTMAPVLIYGYSCQRSLHQFALKRSNDQELQLPLSYTRMDSIDETLSQINSGVITRFDMLTLNKEIAEKEYGYELFGNYCGNKDLYDYLKINNIIKAPCLKWKTSIYLGPLLKRNDTTMHNENDSTLRSLGNPLPNNNSLQSAPVNQLAHNENSFFYMEEKQGIPTQKRITISQQKEDTDSSICQSNITLEG